MLISVHACHLFSLRAWVFFISCIKYCCTSFYHHGVFVTSEVGRHRLLLRHLSILDLWRAISSSFSSSRSPNLLRVLLLKSSSDASVICAASLAASLLLCGSRGPAGGTAAWAWSIWSGSSGRVRRICVILFFAALASAPERAEDLTFTSLSSRVRSCDCCAALDCGRYDRLAWSIWSGSSGRVRRICVILFFAALASAPERAEDLTYASLSSRVWSCDCCAALDCGRYGRLAWSIWSGCSGRVLGPCSLVFCCAGGGGARGSRGGGQPPQVLARRLGKKGEGRKNSNDWKRAPPPHLANIDWLVNAREEGRSRGK